MECALRITIDLTASWAQSTSDSANVETKHVIVAVVIPEMASGSRTDLGFRGHSMTPTQTMRIEGQIPPQMTVLLHGLIPLTTHF